MITWMLLDFQLEQIWWIVSLSAALWLRACCLYCGILKPAVQGKHFCFMRGQLEWLLWASMWKWECLLLTLLSLWHSSRWIGKLVYGYGIAHFFLISSSHLLSPTLFSFLFVPAWVGTDCVKYLGAQQVYQTSSQCGVCGVHCCLQAWHTH